MKKGDTVSRLDARKGFLRRDLLNIKDKETFLKCQEESLQFLIPKPPPSLPFFPSLLSLLCFFSLLEFSSAFRSSLVLSYFKFFNYKKQKQRVEKTQRGEEKAETHTQAKIIEAIHRKRGGGEGVLRFRN